jgi:ABC-type phosphate transport system substrate-binding protein
MRLFSLRWPKMVGGFAVMVGGVALAPDLTGAGSTFVYPILSKWSADYSVKTGASTI